MSTGLDRADGRCAKPWQMMSIDLTGEVAPCPYYHFSSGSLPLGNTNTSDIAEIWNGEGFRDLRRRHAEGDLEGHPCATCMVTRIVGGRFPEFDWGGGFKLNSGHCHIAAIPEQFWERVKDQASEVVLLENGTPLALPGQSHADIRALGGGRYSVWHGSVYASASDNTNPSTNGRIYELALGDDRVAIHTLKEDTAAWRNTHMAYEEYQAGATELQATPNTSSFIETSDCNIDCPACSQNDVRLLQVSHRPETSPAVREMSRSAHEFIWHGGEPYLIPHFRKYIEDHDPEDTPDLSFGFMSNGTMITAEQLRRLERFNRFNITVSIDSFVPETYAKMRAGANYGVVMQNLHRLLAAQDWPNRRVTVAMIIGKSNIRELPLSLRYAMQHHIRMMINPILFYPPTEKLDIFQDFAADTAGWREALDEAEGVLEMAARENARFLQGLDAGALVRVVREVFEQQTLLHKDTVEITLDIDDRHGRLAKMRRPGVVLIPEGGGASDGVAYAEIPPGASSVIIRAPRASLTTRVAIVFHPDLFEQRTTFHRRDWTIDPRDHQRSATIRRSYVIPAYENPPRPRNILYVKRDMRNDVRVDDNVALMRAYELLRERERAAGYGFTDRKTRHTSESPPGDGQGWRGFLVNYFRPFNADVFTRRNPEDASKQRHR
jgi:radical SAM protein with 4Fe4S-binding SPASM domain